MSYDQVIAAVGQDAADRLVAFLDVDPPPSGQAVVEYVALVVGAANATAATAAVLSLAQAVADALGVHVRLPATPVPPSAHHTDLDRLRTAAGTVLMLSQDDPAGRLRRLALAETADSAADAYSRALTADTRVAGWRRALDSDACQLCRWWWREGRVWPRDHPMPRHKGCLCAQEPVTELNGADDD